MTLSIERIDLIVLSVVESFHREVFVVACDINNSVLRNSSIACVPEEMVVLALLIVEKVDED